MENKTENKINNKFNNKSEGTNEKRKHIIYVCIVAVLFFGLSVTAWLKPADEFSATERRALDQFPKLSGEEIFSGRFMEQFEEYTLDQFPLRDTFRSVKAMTHFYVFGQSDNNDVYLADGYVSKLDYPLSEKALDKAVKKFSSIYNKYMAGTDVKVYHAVIPDKNYFLTGENGYPAYDYEQMFAYLKENLPDMTYIDIMELLSVEDFYSTDTHWRQECIVDVAKALGNAMGTTLEAEYEQVTLDTPFYGVYYGQLALPVEPDIITYLEHEDFAECTIINHETGKEIAMYDANKAVGRDPYEMFLSGSLLVITIDNPNASTDKELVIFRDSFGSSLAPLLVEGYAKVTILDARYLNEVMIGKFVEFDNQDVLFIHSTGVLNNETAF